MTQCFALDDSSSNYWTKYLSYQQYVLVKHQQNSYWTLPIDSNSQACLVQCFALKLSISAKTSFLTGYQYQSDLQKCTDMPFRKFVSRFTNLFSLQKLLPPLRVQLVTQCRKTEETIIMHILAHFDTTLLHFKNFKNVILSFSIT